uniref:HTH_Tnp_4 domain-containing protein n=1 Tax=Strongyloides venezuelensis TaxID=75913 RepID=A0A0K0FGR4_STRVS
MSQTWPNSCSVAERRIATLHLAYLWLLKTPVNGLIVQCGLSNATVVSYVSYFRQLVSESLNEENPEIVGKEIVEENNETKTEKQRHGTIKEIDERLLEITWRQVNNKNL